MRRLILMASVALGLAACGKSNQADNTSIANDNLTAESIVSNDVTAIDAVTGDAANMATDVDMNEGDLSNAGSADNSVAPSRPVPHERSKPAAANTTEDSSSGSASNSTTNAD